MRIKMDIKKYIIEYLYILAMKKKKKKIKKNHLNLIVASPYTCT